MSRISKSSRAKRTASRCTLVTRGHVASIACSPRSEAALTRRPGETPCALKTTCAPSGTSSTSSTKIAPFFSSVGDDVDVVHDLLAHVHRVPRTARAPSPLRSTARSTRRAVPARGRPAEPSWARLDGDILEASRAAARTRGRRGIRTCTAVEAHTPESTGARSVRGPCSRLSRAAAYALRKREDRMTDVPSGPRSRPSRHRPIPSRPRESTSEAPHLGRAPERRRSAASSRRWGSVWVEG